MTNLKSITIFAICVSMLFMLACGILGGNGDDIVKPEPPKIMSETQVADGCTDFKDNDGDGVRDCDDSDCAHTRWCPEPKQYVIPCQGEDNGWSTPIQDQDTAAFERLCQGCLKANAEKVANAEASGYSTRTTDACKITWFGDRHMKFGIVMLKK